MSIQMVWSQHARMCIWGIFKQLTAVMGRSCPSRVSFLGGKCDFLRPNALDPHRGGELSVFGIEIRADLFLPVASTIANGLSLLLLVVDVSRSAKCLEHILINWQYQGGWAGVAAEQADGGQTKQCIIFLRWSHPVRQFCIQTKSNQGKSNQRRDSCMGLSYGSRSSCSPGADTLGPSPRVQTMGRIWASCTCFH